MMMKWIARSSILWLVLMSATPAQAWGPFRDWGRAVGSGIRGAGDFLNDRKDDAVNLATQAWDGAVQTAQSVGQAAVTAAEITGQAVAGAGQAALPVVEGVLVAGAVIVTAPIWVPVALGTAAVSAAADFAAGLGDGLTGEGNASPSPAVAPSAVAAAPSPSPDPSPEAVAPPSPEGIPAAAPSAAAQPGFPAQGYTIVSGDTLGTIATQLAQQLQRPPDPPPVWGTGGLVQVLSRCNADTISNPNLIFTGSTLRIPSEEELRGDPAIICN